MVKIYHSTHLPPLSGLYPIESDIAVDQKVVTDLASQYQIPPENCHVADDEISSSLPALASELGASVVLMGAVSRSRLDRLLIGNTAEKVLDNLIL